MKPLSLLALYEGYVTVYRGWERRGIVPLKRVRQLEHHQTQLALFLEERQTLYLAAQAFDFEQATHFHAWLTGTQHYSLERAAKHVRRLQRVLWWGVEQAYMRRNPLAGFCCPVRQRRPAATRTTLLSLHSPGYQAPEQAAEDALPFLPNRA